MTDETVERRFTAFLVPWPVAAVILAVILAAFALGGWRLNEIQHDYSHKLAVVARDSAKDYTNKIATSAVKTSCENGNEFRRLDKARWDKLLGLLGPPRTEDGRRIIEQFSGFIRLADAQRDCSVPLAQ